MTQSWGHTKFSSPEKAQIAKTVDAIISARKITDIQAQKELGWDENGGIYRLRNSGYGISKRKVNDLRIWIRRWMHVLSQEGPA